MKNSFLTGPLLYAFQLLSTKSSRNDAVRSIDDETVINNLRLKGCDLQKKKQDAKTKKVQPVGMLQKKANEVSTATVDSLADVMEDTNMKNVDS